MNDLSRKNRRQGHALAAAVVLLACLVALMLRATTVIPTNQLTMLGVGGALLGAFLWPILPSVFDRQTGA